MWKYTLLSSLLKVYYYIRRKRCSIHDLIIALCIVWFYAKSFELLKLTENRKSILYAYDSCFIADSQKKSLRNEISLDLSKNPFPLAENKNGLFSKWLHPYIKELRKVFFSKKSWLDRNAHFFATLILRLDFSKPFTEN